MDLSPSKGVCLTTLLSYKETNNILTKNKIKFVYTFIYTHTYGVVEEDH